MLVASQVVNEITPRPSQFSCWIAFPAGYLRKILGCYIGLGMSRQIVTSQEPPNVARLLVGNSAGSQWFGAVETMVSGVGLWIQSPNLHISQLAASGTEKESGTAGGRVEGGSD